MSNINHNPDVSFAEKEAWFHARPLSSDGCPTSDLVANILSDLMEQPQEQFDLNTIAKNFNLHPELMRIVLRQLQLFHLVQQVPPDSDIFQYNQITQSSRNLEFRRNVEKEVLEYYKKSENLVLPKVPEISFS